MEFSLDKVYTFRAEHRAWQEWGRRPKHLLRHGEGMEEVAENTVNLGKLGRWGNPSGEHRSWESRGRVEASGRRPGQEGRLGLHQNFTEDQIWVTVSMTRLRGHGLSSYCAACLPSNPSWAHHGLSSSSAIVSPARWALFASPQ